MSLFKVKSNEKILELIGKQEFILITPDDINGIVLTNIEPDRAIDLIEFEILPHMKSQFEKYQKEQN